MNKTQIRNLLAIARSGSLSRASDILHISQPALTRSLNQLEKEYDVKLFERRPRGVFPTMYGDVLLQHAEAMEFELHRARQELAALKNRQAAGVRIGAAPIALQTLVPQVTLRFLEEEPNAAVTVAECTYLNPFDEPAIFLSGESDFLIGILFDDTESGRLVQEVLFGVDVRIAMRHDHPLAGATDVTFDDLLSYRWILPPSDTVPNSLLQASLRAHRLQYSIPPVETIHRQVIFQLLRDSDMVAFIAHHPFCVPTDWQGYTTLPLSMAYRPHPIGIIRRASTPLLPAAKRYIEILKSVISSQG